MGRRDGEGREGKGIAFRLLYIQLVNTSAAPRYNGREGGTLVPCTPCNTNSGFVYRMLWPMNYTRVRSECQGKVRPVRLGTL